MGFLDTGSVFTCISTQLFKKNFAHMESLPSYGCSGAGGNAVSVVDWVHLTLGIASSEFLVRIIVIDNLAHPLILGNNLTPNTTIDTKTNKWTLDSCDQVDLHMWDDAFDDIHLCNVVHSGDASVLVIDSPTATWQQDVLAISSDTNSPDTKALLKALRKKLADILSLRLQSVESQQLKDEITHKYTLLEAVVEAHLLLFTLSFRARQIKSIRVKLNFKKDADLTPKVARVKPLSEKELRIVQKWIEEGLKKNIIEPSTSPWRSSVFPVKKPDKILPDGKVIPLQGDHFLF